MRNSIYSSQNIFKLLVLVTLVWIIITLYKLQPDFRYQYEFDQNEIKMIPVQLRKAMDELETLKAQLEGIVQNHVFFNELSESNANNNSPYLNSIVIGGPDQQYELTRRRLVSNLDELRFFLSNNLVLNETIMSFVNQHYASYQYDLNKIAERDLQWRQNKFQKLKNIVNKVIYQLQNPVDCDSANKLLCDLDKNCGFGCQIHHVVYCFVVALASNRTLIVNTHKWRYFPSLNSTDSSSLIDSSGWNSIFKPLTSHLCTSNEIKSTGNWSLETESKIVSLPIIENLNPRPGFLPLAIPEEISQELIAMHGLPSAWFIGHILNYIMRPSIEMESFLAEARNKIKFRTPIVGVQVRRTDKIGTEAAFHSLSEYMRYVEEYYDRLEIFQERANKSDPVERIIYLATDEASIWTNDTKPFQEKGYIFIGDPQIAQTADLDHRYTIDSLKNLIVDIHLLSECDFLVCTFSSQVCRVAYELMQTREFDGQRKLHFDWSNDFVSLDDIYYFGGQNAHNRTAILNHTGSVGEIDLKGGDIVGIGGNLWNGYSVGNNRRTNTTGLFPGFKTEDRIVIAKFKAFENIYDEMV